MTKDKANGSENFLSALRSLPAVPTSKTQTKSRSYNFQPCVIFPRLASRTQRSAKAIPLAGFRLFQMLP